MHFFQRLLQRGKQDSIQFHVKSNFILICGHFSSLIVVEVGELRTEWIGSLHVSSSFPQVQNDNLAFPWETAVNLTLGARMTGTLIMNSFCWGLPFSAYFFFFTACSPEYEHSCLTKFTYFASLAYWPSFLYEKWNSNVKRQCQKDGMEMSQLVPYQVCEWGFILLNWRPLFFSPDFIRLSNEIILKRTINITIRCFGCW